MKKNKLFLALMLLFSVQSHSCRGQNKVAGTNPQSNTVEALKIYYKKSQSVDGTKYRNLFFASFPSDFKTFNSIYGYDDKKGAMPLYKVYEKHISFFCSLSSTQTEADFASKLIKLGINGRWDADGVNDLQVCIISNVRSKPALIVAKLKAFKPEEIRSFWRFLYDGSEYTLFRCV